MCIEQINNTTGTVTYLHHDQAGSTRLLTGSTGTVTGKCTYGAYGTPTCEGTTTTPLGYDAQYTNSDTGLIYLRAREYDPATAQFLNRDPAVALTREPYAYAGDDPLTYKDRSGLGIEEVLEGGSQSLNAHLEDLLTRLNPAKDSVREFAQRARSEAFQSPTGLPFAPVVLSLDIYARNPEQPIGFDISNHQLKAISDLGAVLTVEVESYDELDTE
jgi:RHS repeat-associated protein